MLLCVSSDDGRRRLHLENSRWKEKVKISNLYWLAVGGRGAGFSVRISKFFLLSDQWRIEGGRLLARWQRLMMLRMKKTRRSSSPSCSVFSVRDDEKSLSTLLFLYSTFSSSPQPPTLLYPRRAAVDVLVFLRQRWNDWTSLDGQSNESWATLSRLRFKIEIIHHQGEKKERVSLSSLFSSDRLVVRHLFTRA